MPTPALNEQLDKLEASLPAVPARVVRLQRTLAGAACDRTTAVVTAVAESTKRFLDTARNSGKTATRTVTGPARDAADDQPGSGRPYEQWTKAQLLERANELGIAGRYGLDKRGLIAALRAN